MTPACTLGPPANASKFDAPCLLTIAQTGPCVVSAPLAIPVAMWSVPAADRLKSASLTLMCTIVSPLLNVVDDVNPLPVTSRCNGNTPLRLVTLEPVAPKSFVVPAAAIEPNGTGYTDLSNVIEPVLPLTPALSLTSIFLPDSSLKST